jgi:hypothetical protein
MHGKISCLVIDFSSFWSFSGFVQQKSRSTLLKEI